MFFNELTFVKKDISNISQIKNAGHRVWGKNQFYDFIFRTKTSTKLLFQEKEIFLFLLLQWVIIGLMYYLWLQMLAWIPQSVWSNDNKLNNDLLNILFLVWSFLAVGVASFPIGILSGCIGASYFLKNEGYSPTIANCFKIVIPKALELWTFFWIDSWITVEQILNRLPKKGRQTDSAGDELLYFAWKLGTIGILPSILNGRNIIDAGKESVKLVLNHPEETLLLRGGYSLFCWVVGIAAYVGGVLFFMFAPYLFGSTNDVYQFYFVMGIPILLAVGIVLFFLRPIFIISSCELYTTYVKEEQLNLKVPAPVSQFTRSLFIFVFLLIIIAIIYFFRDQLGITKILNVQN